MGFSYNHLISDIKKMGVSIEDLDPKSDLDALKNYFRAALFYSEKYPFGIDSRGDESLNLIEKILNDFARGGHSFTSQVFKKFSFIGRKQQMEGHSMALFPSLLESDSLSDEKWNASASHGLSNKLYAVVSHISSEHRLSPKDTDRLYYWKIMIHENNPPSLLSLLEEGKISDLYSTLISISEAVKKFNKVIGTNGALSPASINLDGNRVLFSGLYNTQFWELEHFPRVVSPEVKPDIISIYEWFTFLFNALEFASNIHANIDIIIGFTIKKLYDISENLKKTRTTIIDKFLIFVTRSEILTTLTKDKLNIVDIGKSFLDLFETTANTPIKKVIKKIQLYVQSSAGLWELTSDKVAFYIQDY